MRAITEPPSASQPRPLALLTLTLRPPPSLSQKSILLSGDAGIGKTCYAEAHSGKSCAFIIKTLDMLKDIPGDCNLLIFDDMRFDKGSCQVDPETMIHLLTRDRLVHIKCRNVDGFIPPIARIFLSNLKKGTPFPESPEAEQNYAIDRRHRKEPYVKRGELF